MLQLNPTLIGTSHLAYKIRFHDIRSCPVPVFARQYMPAASAMALVMASAMASAMALATMSVSVSAMALVMASVSVSVKALVMASGSALALAPGSALSATVFQLSHPTRLTKDLLEH